MPTSVELRAQRANIWDRMQEIVDSAESANRNLSTEEQANFDQAGRDMDALMERVQRMEALEVTRADLTASNQTTASHAGMQINGPQTSVITDQRGITLNDETRRRYARWQSMATQRQVDPEQVDVSLVHDYTASFNRYLRLHNGGQPLAHEDYATLGRYQNVLATTSGQAGGYLIPPEFAAGVERATLWYGSMRQVSNVFSTASGADYHFTVTDDTSNVGEILAEAGTVGTQDTTFQQRVMKAYTYTSKLILVNHQLLNDAAFDVSGHISAIAGERIGRIQNTHFTTGIGPNMPSGIIGDVTTGKTSATATAIVWDELIDLVHSVDISYRGPSCRFMCHDLIMAYLRKLKDGDGMYLWQPGTQMGVPDRLIGYPIAINNDMQSTVATGTTTVVFGDLSRYRIRDVEGMQLMRLEELYAATLQVGFFVFTRADGALIDAGQHPVKALVQA